MAPSTVWLVTMDMVKMSAPASEVGLLYWSRALSEHSSTEEPGMLVGQTNNYQDLVLVNRTTRH